MKRVLKYLSEIVYLLGDDRRNVPGLIILFIGSSLLDLAGLGLIGPYISLIINPEQALGGTIGILLENMGLSKNHEELLLILSFGLFLIFLVKAISSIVINHIIIQFSHNQETRLSSYLMASYQALPYAEYLHRNSSEYVHNVQLLTRRFSESVVLSGLRTLSNGIIALVIVGLLAWSNGLALALLVFMLGAMLFGYDRFFRQNISRYGSQANEAATSKVQGINEGIEGLKEIRILGKESYFLQKVSEASATYAKSLTRSEVISSAPRYLLELVMISFIILIVVFSLLLGDNLKALIPTLGLFGIAALRILPTANIFSQSLISLRFNRDAVSRLYKDLVNIKKTDYQVPVLKTEPAKDFFKVLNMDQVCFRYPKMKRKTLNKVSLEIRAGESIGLIGTSGSGKTTLIDTILGLLEAQEGEIRYNGQMLKHSLDEWRSQVAYLPQQVFLIDDTLCRNITLSSEGAKVNEILLQKALVQARLQELVDQLPSGVDTILGERGVRISGGQRQRVALARAFYHRRNIIVMDEATSSLDNETEQEIVEEIKHLKGRKTIIVIAHRISTVMYCDRIYRLEEGRIVGQGTYEQVMSASNFIKNS